jgi:hypothetical protein
MRPRRALWRVGSSIGAPSRLCGESPGGSARPAPGGKNPVANSPRRCAENLQVATHRRGAVGQHHIEAVQGQIGEQGFEFAFVANQTDIDRHAGHGREQAVGEQFRNAVGNAGAQAQRRFVVAAADRIDQRVTKLENLVGETECRAPGFAEYQAAPLAIEQALPSWRSSKESWPLIVCTATPSRSAARVMLPSWATTQK